MKSKDNQAELAWVLTKEVEPSEENPRKDDFYKDKDFLRLKESVAKYGVIVPIIIKKITKQQDKKKYRLIDGERRWRAAIDTNQKRIPAYVLPPHKEIDVLTTMFQIHMNQEEWEAIEQAKALETTIYSLRNKLKQKYRTQEKIEKELESRLMDLTGMDQPIARNRVRFFRWPKDVREYIYTAADKDYYSYVVEIEARIVEPALRNFPDLKARISPKQIRRLLFEKVAGGIVQRAVEIRDAAILTKRRSGRRQKSTVVDLLYIFITDKSIGFSEAREHYISLFPDEAKRPAFSVKKLINTVTTLAMALGDYTEATIKGIRAKQKRDLMAVLEEFINVGKKVLRRLKQ